MKKVFTLCLITLIAFSMKMNGQSQRLILCEEFTQASCGPCAIQNPNFNGLLNSNANKVVSIKYQTDWPGYDPMNIQTAYFDSVRVAYYGPGGVPYTVFDGTPLNGAAGNAYLGAPYYCSQPKIDSTYAIPSPFDMSVSHTFSADFDSIFITCIMNATQAVSGNLKLHTVVIERTIDWCEPPGTNGETEFEGVSQMMIPSVFGQGIAASWTIGQGDTITYAEALPSFIYDKSKLAVVAFIQDYPSRNVHQAAYSAPQPQHFVIDARIGCDKVSGIPKVSCSTPLNTTVEIENMGQTPLTSLNISYMLDGVPGSAIPQWTGNLATNGTATIQIPTINTTAGQHKLFVMVSDPNSTTDYNKAYDSLTVIFNVYGTTGNSLPLQEDFTIDASGNYTFPPAFWTRYTGALDTLDDMQWIQSFYGMNDTGATRLNFYFSHTGYVDDLWTTNYDFSSPGMTGAQLDFDCAYVQFINGTAISGDRLQVLYSTDCGASWSAPVFDEANAVLAAGNGNSDSSWYPTNASYYHHKTASLANAIGNSSVFLAFRGISGYGNNCFIDNVNVSFTTSTGKLEPIKDVNIYPNPSTGDVHVKLNLQKSNNVSINVINSLGSIVKTVNLTDVYNDVYTLHLQDQAKGTYQISVISGDQVFSKRISITE